MWQRGEDTAVSSVIGGERREVTTTGGEVILSTGLRKGLEETDLLNKCRKLGVKISSSHTFSDSVTCLIIGRLIITEKLKCALAHGIPIVGTDYILHCTQAGKWVNNYEEFDLGNPSHPLRREKPKFYIPTLKIRKQYKSGGGIFNKWRVLLIVERKGGGQEISNRTILQLGGANIHTFTLDQLPNLDAEQFQSATHIIAHPTFLLNSHFTRFLERNRHDQTPKPVITTHYINDILTKDRLLRWDMYSVVNTELIEAIIEDTTLRKKLLKIAELQKRYNKLGPHPIPVLTQLVKTEPSETGLFWEDDLQLTQESHPPRHKETSSLPTLDGSLLSISPKATSSVCSRFTPTTLHALSPATIASPSPPSPATPSSSPSPISHRIRREFTEDDRNGSPERKTRRVSPGGGVKIKAAGPFRTRPANQLKSYRDYSPRPERIGGEGHQPGREHSGRWGQTRGRSEERGETGRRKRGETGRRERDGMGSRSGGGGGGGRDGREEGSYRSRREAERRGIVERRYRSSGEESRGNTSMQSVEIEEPEEFLWLAQQ